ncbi:aspartyl-tRNA synthetase domain protein [Mycobacterium ulcerans str. Harvey]|uniref:Aspartyl-tRNA synthetase domain protein n=1 Tax=Mycobacterium ulcerans str. Harvey TaxID=1299332 RepID=A0ABP3AM48_MYCUL|nr:aspartyl-tRNA synthetase domain protein [Mycobacterium ulcerans str. Harvey]
MIAFPKTGGGVDPLTEAPAPITAQQRKEAGIDAKPKQVEGHDARDPRRRDDQGVQQQHRR